MSVIKIASSGSIIAISWPGGAARQTADPDCVSSGTIKSETKST